MTMHSRCTASQLSMNSENPKDSGLRTPECSLSQRTATAGVTAFRGEAGSSEAASAKARDLLSKTI
jgi:hypothetical protein